MGQMGDRRITIIEQAMKLFATKGYHSTSIKEIADESGIAKGTFYNYFESKQDIMLSILKYYTEMMNQELDRIANDHSLNAKDIFLKQIHFQFQESLKHRDFIQMHIREHALHINEEVNEFLVRMRATRMNWLTDRLSKVYGEKIDNFLYDLATMLNGFMREYFEYIILDKMEFEIDKLSKFILNRIDDLVTSFLKNGDYFLEYSDFREILKLKVYSHGQLNIKLKGIIQQVLDSLDTLSLSAEMVGKTKTTMEVFEDEFIHKEEPNLIVIEGLLLFLRTLNIPSLELYWNQLDEIFLEYRETI